MHYTLSIEVTIFLKHLPTLFQIELILAGSGEFEDCCTCT